MEGGPGLRRYWVVDSRGRTLGVALVRGEVEVENVLVEAGEPEGVIPGSELEELDDLMKRTVEQEARVTRNLVKDIVGEIVADAVKTSYKAHVGKDDGKEGSKMSMSKTLAAAMAINMLKEMKESKKKAEKEETRGEELLSRVNERLSVKDAIVPQELIKPPLSKAEETPVNLKTTSAKMGVLREFCIKLGEGEKVKCKLCEKTYSSKSFGCHMRTMHLPDETCPGCGKDFRPNQLFRHQQQCAEFSPGFNKQLSLIRSKHQDSRNQEECPKCSKMLFGNIKRHLGICKGQPTNPTKPSQADQQQLPAQGTAGEGRKRSAESEGSPGTSGTNPSKLVKQEDKETEADEVKKVDTINDGVKGEVMASTETEVMDEDSVDSLHLLDSSDGD